MLKKVPLKTISKSVSSGFSFREKIKNDPNGNIRVIQLKDFENNYTSIGEDCYIVDGSKIKNKYILNSGDILFISKGSNNYALSFYKKDDFPSIASSSLFVIQVDETVAYPPYIAWYINQKKIQTYLKTNEMGTYVPNINKSTVEQMPIELPTIEKQMLIAKIAELNNKEQNIYHRITELKNIETQQKLLKSISK